MKYVSAKINIKPLSVNEAWQGKRFKTTAYKKYERDLILSLPTKNEIPDGNLALIAKFGFSSSASDVDNPIKPFIDILQKKYGFDDKRITQIHIFKTKVGKGGEFIDFRLAGAFYD